MTGFWLIILRSIITIHETACSNVIAQSMIWMYISYICVCVCVSVCVRACVRACVCVCTPLYLIHALKNKDSNDITFVASVCIQLVSVFFMKTNIRMSPISIRICVTNLVSFPTVVSKKEGWYTNTQTNTHTHTHTHTHTQGHCSFI